MWPSAKKDRRHDVVRRCLLSVEPAESQVHLADVLEQLLEWEQFLRGYLGPLALELPLGPGQALAEWLVLWMPETWPDQPG